MEQPQSGSRGQPLPRNTWRCSDLMAMGLPRGCGPPPAEGMLMPLGQDVAGHGPNHSCRRSSKQMNVDGPR